MRDMMRVEMQRDWTETRENCKTKRDGGRRCKEPWAREAGKERNGGERRRVKAARRTVRNDKNSGGGDRREME